ncbi:helix-turn-helix domain-containing protein [Listeria booriae]|uniref:helix-turn-helix domain-containing protein n=1 Tax=Listeria booriae TaxID=1552123 RepID=UPI00162370A0|nr:helix-turn-helix transcriptional regulator [Listeria booriae]
MSTFDIIKSLANERGKNVKDVALELGFGENLFYKWKTQSPTTDKLQKVADYFGVSLDYLAGRTTDRYSHITIDEKNPIAQEFLKSPKAIEFMKKINSTDEKDLEKLDLLWEIIHEKKN